MNDDLVADKVDAAKQEVLDKITTVFEFKSTISSPDMLPEQGEKVGQVYVVRSEDEHNGEEYVWAELQDGTRVWELLGSYMRYYTKQQTYNKDEVNELITLLTSQLGNVSFVETTDGTFQDNKDYYVYSQTLKTYIICDVSSGIGELIPPGIYFEFNGMTVASRLNVIEQAIESLTQAAESLDQAIATTMTNHKGVSSGTQQFSTLDTTVIHDEHQDKDLDLISIFNLVNAMIPVINKLVELHVHLFRDFTRSS